MSNDTVNFTRALVGQGLGLGWGDEAEAWLKSKASGTDYQDELDAIRQDYAKFSERHPVAAPVTEFTGGMLPVAASYIGTAMTGGGAAPGAAVTTGRALGALGKLARNPVVQGTVLGGIAGAGAADEENRVGGGATGAILGGGAGLAIPAAVRGGSSLYRWAGEHFAPSAERSAMAAAERINRAMAEANLTPEDVTRIMKRDVAQGIPSTLANADPALVDIAETVAQRSGPSARRVEETLGAQARGSRQRVWGRSRRALGGRDYFEDEQKLVEDLRKRAGDVYSDAYAVGSVNDPRITEILKNPRFKSFYDEARKIADAEALAAKVAGEDPSRYALEEIYSVGPDGELILSKLPDVRTLDYIKRGIDAVIDRGFKGDNALSTAEASALRNLRKAYVEIIDEVTTDPATGISPYKTARQSYAGDMEVIDALRTGRAEFKKMSHQEVERLMGEMGEAEKDAFRTGVLQHVYEQIMNSNQNINAAQRMIGSPETVKKLRPLFESDAKFRLFQNAMQREAQLMQQAQRVLQGSPTKRRLQAEQRFVEGDGAGAFMQDLVTGGPRKGLMGLVTRAMQWSDMTDQMADEAAKMLMSSNPDEVAAAVTVLERAAENAAKRTAGSRALERELIGGSAAALPPSPVVDKEVDIESDFTSEGAIPDGPDIEADFEALQQ